MAATTLELDRTIDWRTTASADSPAGPLFSDEYAEADLVSQDPMMLECSLATGSYRVNCCA